ncbi:restriction endonuclease subunit S [Methanolobus psychrotolerans]|uniref:restriction endonuclease subunit S n=1 Tax=Methanolobus psychrotolerans TaxID=1874706 RepID=UPI000B9197C7|nr:restriction endonuclease subunit S [Methanolobus psychrotolerans]
MNVLLSIKPKYVNEILEGKKLFEFRKAIFKKKDISKVFIYSSSPIKKIVASFEIARIIEDSPQKLWDKCHEYGGIPENDFFEYFKNSDTAYAIEISNLDEFSEKIDPYKLKKNFRPPQSYCYLSLDYFDQKLDQNTSRTEYEAVFLAEDSEEYGANVSAFDEESTGLNQFTEPKERKIGWIDAELNNITEIIMGQSPPSSTYNSEGMGLPFFQGKAEFTELHPIVSKWCSKPNKIAEPNDILISVRAPVGATNIANQKCCIGRGLAAIRYPSCNKYVFYFLRLIEKELDKKGTGTTFKAISGAVLKSEIIPLPPLPEQRAIVSKIELLFSELDNGIANLKLAQEQLKVYRQAVLKKAFEGELTRKWREQQVDLPSAEELLVEIRREREEAQKSTLRKIKNVKTLTEEEILDLSEIPIGWKWLKLQELCNLVGGVTKGRKLEGKKTIILPYLRVANVQDGYLDLSEIKHIEVLEGDLEKYRLIRGDILYTEGGDKDKLGRGTIWKEQIENCIHQNHVFRARPYSKSLVSAYIGYFSQTQTAKDYFFKKGKQTVNLASINMTVLSNLPFPLCSLPEQQAIVSEIEMRLSVCDKVEQDIAENLEKAEALRQSILKKAFEGKLLSERELEEVRKAEDWEPAEVLLERVKGEKAIAGKR